MNYFDKRDCDNEIPSIVNYLLNFCDDSSDFINYLPKIKIEISDDEVYRHYKGKYTNTQIVKIIEDTSFKNTRAKELSEGLKKELLKSPKEIKESTLIELIEALKKLLKDKEDLTPFDEDKIKRIIDAFNQRDFISIVLGTYKSRKITLYRKSIINNTYGYDAICNMKRVLLHEMVHAYHHYIFDGGKCVLTRFVKQGYGSVAKESLARFIEYNYCADELNRKYCRELERNWNTHFFEIYPYAGAKYLEETALISSEKIALAKKLLVDGKPDLIGAYHDIVYLYKVKEGFVLGSTISNNKKTYIKNSIANYKPFIYEQNSTQNKLNFIAISKVEDELSKRQASFPDVLFKMLKAKNMTEPECYKAARIDKSAFSKMISGKTRPNRKNVSLLAIALRLNSEEYEEFTRAAGHARSFESNDPINIVGVYIDNNEYNLDEIELAVKEFTGSTLANYYDGEEQVAPSE